MGDVVVLGLSLGCIYGLVAVGVTLVYRTTGVLNFSQGGAVMLGGVATGYLIDSWGWPLWVAGVTGIAIAGLSGLALAGLVVIPLWRRGADEFIVALGSLLFLLIMINATTNLLGTEPKIVPDLGVPTVEGLGTRVPGQVLAIVAVTLVALVLLELFLRRTLTGVAMRAVAVNREVSTMLGISPAVFAVLAITGAAVVAGIGGFLIAPLQVAVVGSAHVYNVAGFAAAIFGGLRSVRAAVLGGVVIGLIESFVALHVTTTYLQVVMLSVLILLLVLRPRGVFGSHEEEVKY